VTIIIPALMLAAAAVLIITGPGRRSRAVRRLGASLLIGTAAGGALAAVVDARHAALAAVPPGGHVSAAGSLMDGFAGTALGVTVLAFVLLTVASRRRVAARDLAARRRADRELAEGRPARRRRAAARGGDLR
jgi:hypothetical protein